MVDKSIEIRGRIIKIGPLNFNKLRARILKKLDVNIMGALAKVERHSKFLIFRSDYLYFDTFFALEFYIIFYQLGYRDFANLIKEQTWVKELFNATPLSMDYSAIEKAGIKLYDYQKSTLEKYAIDVPKLYLRGNLLNLQMGLGKTITSIAIQLARKKERVVVIVPKSLIEQWYETLTQYNQKVCKYNPDSDCKWLLINYERISQIPESFLSGNVGMIVDEAHYLRNMSTQRTQHLIELLSKHSNISDIVLLTGTPIISKIEEVIPYLIILDPNVNVDLWRLWISIFMNNPEQSKALAKFRFTYYFKTLTYQDTDIKLPQKKEITLTLKVPHIERYEWPSIREEVLDKFQTTIDKRQKQYFKTRDELFKKILKQLDKNQQNKFKQLWKTNIEEGINYLLSLDLDLTKEERDFLRKVPVKERNFNISEYLSLLMNTLVQRRIEIIDQVIKSNISTFCKIINKSYKSVIYSTIVPALQQDTKYLSDHCDFDYEIITSELSSEMRNEAVKRFLDNENIKVLSMSDVGSLGLNLQEADTMIVLNYPWRASTLEQVKARIRRLGSKNDITVYTIVIPSKEMNVHDHFRQIAKEMQMMIKKYETSMSSEVQVPE